MQYTSLQLVHIVTKSKVQCRAVQFCRVQYSVKQCSAVQCSAVQWPCTSTCVQLITTVALAKYFLARNILHLPTPQTSSLQSTASFYYLLPHLHPSFSHNKLHIFIFPIFCSSISKITVTKTIFCTLHRRQLFGRRRNKLGLGKFKTLSPYSNLDWRLLLLHLPLFWLASHYTSCDSCKNFLDWFCPEGGVRTDADYSSNSLFCVSCSSLGRPAIITLP